MFKRMIKMVMRIIAAGIVSDPMAVVMNVGRIGVVRSIREVPIWLYMRGPVIFSGPVSRRMSRSGSSMSASVGLCSMLLWPRGQRKNKYCRN